MLKNVDNVVLISKCQYKELCDRYVVSSDFERMFIGLMYNGRALWHFL